MVEIAVGRLAMLWTKGVQVNHSLTNQSGLISEVGCSAFLEIYTSGTNENYIKVPSAFRQTKYNNTVVGCVNTKSKDLYRGKIQNFIEIGKF